MTTNPRTIITEVGLWANEQPWGGANPKHAPDWGVIEEVGELMHGILKNYQGIRGFDNADKFREHTVDALGDAMVYLSHWCYLNGVYYTLIEDGNLLTSPCGIRVTLVQLLVNLTKLVSLSTYPSNEQTSLYVATETARAFQTLAFHLGYDLLRDCLVPTWHKVKTRDWNKDKMLGGQKSYALGLGAPSSNRDAELTHEERLMGFPGEHLPPQ